MGGVTIHSGSGTHTRNFSYSWWLLPNSSCIVNPKSYILYFLLFQIVFLNTPDPIEDTTISAWVILRIMLIPENLLPGCFAHVAVGRLQFLTTWASTLGCINIFIMWQWASSRLSYLLQQGRSCNGSYDMALKITFTQYPYDSTGPPHSLWKEPYKGVNIERSIFGEHLEAWLPQRTLHRKLWNC